MKSFPSLYKTNISSEEDGVLHPYGWATVHILYTHINSNKTNVEWSLSVVCIIFQDNKELYVVECGEFLSSKVTQVVQGWVLQSPESKSNYHPVVSLSKKLYRHFSVMFGFWYGIENDLYKQKCFFNIRTKIK